MANKPLTTSTRAAFPPLPLGEGRGEGGGEGSQSEEEFQANPQPSATRERTKLPPPLLENARTLRAQQTVAESLLWRLLRNRQMVGCKFRRQHPVGPYILDFYCHEKKLAIELDGGQHNTESGRANDQKRTEFLMSEGIAVLRFWNHEVIEEKAAVLERVYGVLGGHPHPGLPHPGPLPEGEGENQRVYLGK